MIGVQSVQRKIQLVLARRAEKALLREAKCYWVGSRRGLKHIVRRYVRSNRHDRNWLDGVWQSASLAGAAALLALQLYASPVEAATPTFAQHTGVTNPFNGFSTGYVSTPQFADFDNDGDLDVLSGTGNGGWVYFENTGNANNPIYVQQTGVDNPMDGFTNGSGFTDPAIADIDGDGDLDVLSGINGGEFLYFENTGTASTPIFVERLGIDNPMDVNSIRPDFRSTPTFVDLDNDGDFDIMSGAGDAGFYYFENTGNANTPVFTQRTGSGNPMDGQDVIHPSEFSYYSNPAFADLDGDGDLDIISGSYYLGQYFYFENTGDVANPVFVERTGNDNPLSAFNQERDTAPSFGDIDGDGDMDLVVGQNDGEYFYFENTTPLPPSMVALLLVGDAFGAPGGQVVVDVILDSPTEAAGIEFKIRPLDPPPPEQSPPLSEFASLNGIINNLESEGFSVAHSTDGNGVTTVLVFHSGGGFIETGPQSILGLAYQVGSEAPPAHLITLEISDVVLSDIEAVSIDHESEEGSIAIGVLGDVVGGDFGAGDGNVNMLDIIKTIKYVLAILPAPDSQDDPFLFWSLDVNSDGNLDVLDIVGMVNLFLYGDEEPPEVKSVVRQLVLVGLEEGQSAQDGYVHVSITFDVTSQLGGLQADMTFDPSRLTIGPASLFGGIEGLTVQHHVVDGRLKILLYSLDGQTLPIGRQAISVPVRLRDTAQLDGWLSLGNVVLSDRNARSVPVIIGETSIKITEAAGVYSLSSATPNPFNPATTISYVVPRQGHVTLTVFNLLGQEIVKLVDSVQAAGTYRAVWPGTDAAGREVSSGIYMYRLNSETGFTETRRMTLLK